MLSRKLKNGYVTVAEAAEMLFCSKSRICSLCRQKFIYGARKERGRWQIPFTGLFPVLRKSEYTEAREEIEQLRFECSLSDIGYACSILTNIAGYNEAVLAFQGKGKSEIEARLCVLEHCDYSLYFYERLSSEYNRHGIRGLIKYIQACELLTGWPFIDSTADEAYIAKTLNKHYEPDSFNHGQVLNIRWYIDLISEFDNEKLDKIRESLERSKEGQQIVTKNPNRRLYAVLKPTREENLQRIEYVLTGIGTFGLFDMLASIKIGQEINEYNYSDTE